MKRRMVVVSHPCSERSRVLMSEAELLNFHHLLGQDKARKMLARALKSERIPHGYLFHGPMGVGKMLFARALAAALHCRQRKGVDSCGKCSECRKMRSMNHPDFLRIGPEKGSIRIAQIRELIRKLDYPPYESSMRVVVLEDVQSMGQEAANCLLKTLEEPPPHNLLILTADTSRELLPTIRSRCQLVPFVALSQVDTTAILVREGIDDKAAQLLARLAEGCPGRAIRLNEREMLPLYQEVTSVLADPQIDPELDLLPLLGLAERIAGLKEDLREFFGLLKLWVRDSLLVDQESLSEAEGQTRTGNLNNWSSRQLFATLQTIARAEAQLARNCNRNLVSEVLLFELQRRLARS